MLFHVHHVAMNSYFVYHSPTRTWSSQQFDKTPKNMLYKHQVSKLASEDRILQHDKFQNVGSLAWFVTLERRSKPWHDIPGNPDWFRFRDPYGCCMIPSLKLTFSPLKMVVSNWNLLDSSGPPFSLLVSGRVIPYYMSQGLNSLSWGWSSNL